MAILKCKMCGGDLEVTDGLTVCECEYCGTKQTVSATKDEVITNLYNRANNLRLKCEFDKAEAIYDKIVEKDDSESEAHWGIVLCKYGIEYVDDPETATKIPTCHRTLFEAIRADADYQAAVDYADSMQQAIYEKEAIAIDKIQKNILEIVKNEKPFDVFICYKETDENGNRTIDSTIANDIYYQLTETGFKVFYAAITLEDKLGQEYEPYIFAALNSSKVMLVLGTNPMYFNAVWVKNEWSRYLKLMKTDRDKLLIPCYRDMDAYELPEEFAHLQAQDMSKIGFINDVIRGIKKVLVVEETAPTETVVQSNTSNVAPLLERAFMFLEDKEWDSAEEYAERVLDQEPKNANAYLVKLMAELRVSKQDDLKNCEEPFENKTNYEKACRFDDAIRDNLNAYIATINDRNEKAKRIAEEKLAKLNKLIEYSKTHDTSFKKRIYKQLNKLSAEKTVLQKQKIDWENATTNLEILNAENNRLNSQLKVCATERASLGIFASSKKRELDSKMSTLKSKVIENEKSIKELNTIITSGEPESISSKIDKIDRDVSKLQTELNEIHNQEKSTESIDALLHILKDDNIALLIAANDINVSCLLKSSQVLTYINKNNIDVNFFKFGLYANEDIEWQVLVKEDNRVLVITKNIIECKQYNTENTDVTWESCTLRKWLNNDFYNKSFSDEEKALIQTTNVVNKDNARFNTKGGNNTKDKVFLLSIDEAKQYFTSDRKRQCQGTSNAKSNGLSVNPKGKSCWWLRSPGHSQEHAADGDYFGKVDKFGNTVIDGSWGVRPAMWISLENKSN